MRAARIVQHRNGGSNPAEHLGDGHPRLLKLRQSDRAVTLGQALTLFVQRQGNVRVARLV